MRQLHRGPETEETSFYPPWTRRSWIEHATVPLLLTIYAFLSWWVAHRHGVTSILSFDIYTTFIAKLYLIVFSVFLVVYLSRIVFWIRPSLPFAYIRNDLRRQSLSERLALGLPLLVFMPVFFSLFSSMKMLIPYIRPYTWDSAFDQLDRWLHGGRAPWEWLQPIFGNPLATGALNFLYNLWLFVVLTVFFWQAFAVHRRRLRMQFIVAYLLTWTLVGNLAATLLSSAGPCFYGRLPGHADLYAPLMERLHRFSETVPIWALPIQDMLWNIYREAGPDPAAGGGISAMPSVHVASSALMALLGWRVHRGLGIALTAFLVVIMVGAVQLGWHYAVDGYVSLLLVGPIWWLSGRAARWIVPIKPAQSIGE